MLSLHIRAVGFILIFAAVALPASESDEVGIRGPYRVGPGDVLDIVVFEVEELSRPAVVTPRGTISLPLIGELPVEGRTTLEIEAGLKDQYGERYLRDPQISVSVADFRSQPVSVVGAVKEPGVYQLQGDRRLVEVLAMAGGFTEEVGETIAISRQGERSSGAGAGVLGAGAERLQTHAADRDGIEMTVSVRELLTSRDGGEANPVVEPQDVIRVSKAGIVYVMGAVAKPGGFVIKDQERMTVLRAVSLASGFGEHSSPQKSRVIRQGAAGKREILIRIKDVIEGKEPDVDLEANDILYIPDSRAKSALNRSVEAMIQVGTGVAIFRR
jgi:polysaccharide export outer membrane protein